MAEEAEDSSDEDIQEVESSEDDEDMHLTSFEKAKRRMEVRTLKTCQWFCLVHVVVIYPP